MASRRIIQIGDPRLKARNKVVKNYKDLKVKKIIKDLTDTMHKNELIGLAAPQIGYNYRIFVTHARKTDFRPSDQTDELRIYINPKMVKVSKTKNIIYEGCGCVINAQLFGPVKRPSKITIEASDEDGKKFQLECDGILSRVIQHEYDHMFGIEFTEKISDYRKLMHEDFYLKYIRNSKEQKQASKITIIKFSDTK